MNCDEIKNRLTSDNHDVLRQSLGMIDQLLAHEAKRGEGAQARINAMIAIAGSATAISLFLLKFVLEPAFTGFLIAESVAGITGFLLLIKAIYSLTRGMRPTQVQLLTPEIIFDYQSLDRLCSLRHEISWKIWWYEKQQQANTAKLYWLCRGQACVILSFSMFLILGALILTEAARSFWASQPAHIIMGGIFLAAFFWGDGIIVAKSGAFKKKPVQIKKNNDKPPE